MEENIILAPPAFRLYKERSILIGTFIGGPLVAGYLAAANFKSIGQNEKVITTWAIAIFATLVIFGVTFLIPGIAKVPNYLIPLIYTGITQYLIKKYQGDSIEAHLASGGQPFSIWRAVGVGLVGLVLLVVIIVAIILLMNKDSI